jgi:hypothetical protein
MRTKTHKTTVTPPDDDITPEQRQAIIDYAAWKMSSRCDGGCDWVSSLLVDWNRAGSRWTGPYHLLHQLRNQRGPRWLIERTSR